MNAKEIEIPVQWGIISAKTWGSSSNPIILLLHGLEDNANTFDYLVCKLPHEYFYVSVDLPGHGKSDNLPSLGLPLQGMDYVYVMKLLVDHFEKEKYIMIGHSFGAILAMQYGFVYPEKVDKIFILDTLWFQIVKPSEFGTWTRNKFEEFTKIKNQMRKTTSAEFTYDQCYDLTTTWRFPNCELTKRSADTLLERSLVRTESGKYKFTRDPKLRNYLCYPMDERYACEVLKSHKITFKVVVIMTKCNEGYYIEKFPTLVETYKKIADWIPVEGNHHVHLNDPQVTADAINIYLDECVPI